MNSVAVGDFVTPPRRFVPQLPTPASTEQAAPSFQMPKDFPTLPDSQPTTPPGSHGHQRSGFSPAFEHIDDESQDTAVLYPEWGGTMTVSTFTGIA